MSSMVPTTLIKATKQSDGSTVFELWRSNDGTQLSSFVTAFNMVSADTTSLNTNVFGGAANATRTFKQAASHISDIKGRPQQCWDMG